MTDAVAAAAADAAPADTHAVPIEDVTAPPAPLSDAPQPREQVEQPKAVPSTRDALRAAAAKVNAAEEAKAAADKTAADAKDPKKGATLERDTTTGKFAPKDGKAADPAAAAAAAAAKDAPPAPAAKPAATPPAPVASKFTAPERFSNDAKAAWDTAPEPVRAEVDRMHREMTAGIEKHRAGAESFETIREFDEMAKRGGTDLKTALTKYTNLEGLLRQNPMKGLEAVCDNIGVSLRDVAQIVLGQTPDQERSAADTENRELRQKLARLEQQLNGLVGHQQHQQETAIETQIQTWASTRQDYFELIAPHIAAEMQAGATSLDDAEERVFQKYPALASLAKQPAPPAKKEDPDPAASAAAAAELVAQTDKGSKSITGAPTPGSEPAAKARSSSIREALKRAAARAG